MNFCKVLYLGRSGTNQAGRADVKPSERARASVRAFGRRTHKAVAVPIRMLLTRTRSVKLLRELALLAITPVALRLAGLTRKEAISPENGLMRTGLRLTDPATWMLERTLPIAAAAQEVVKEDAAINLPVHQPGGRWIVLGRLDQRIP